MDRVYMCIDLKSFFASVECVERNLNPLTTNLVVADSSRTEKTVCLAITPSLKKYGLGGRARLYEVIKKVNKVNQERRKNINYQRFRTKSYNDLELKKDKYLELDYIIAKPHMAKYMEYSNRIYNIYLKYVSTEDIFVYSIDEVFCDITPYLKISKLTPREFTTKIIHDVYSETGITATAGIGSNLYLAKIAMDIVAKKANADLYGVRISELNEMSYRRLLWDFRPLTKFWRIGPGICKKLEEHNIYTMGDIARTSIDNEDLLYKLFGVNAELIIDHAWGYEPCTINDVKNYKPITNSVSSGQVLHEAYDYKKTKLIVREMTDNLTLDLVNRKVKTNQIIINIGYDVSNLEKENNFEVVKDFYGRLVPKPSHSSINLDYFSSSSSYLCNKAILLFDKIINKDLLVRRLNITFANLTNEDVVNNQVSFKQLDLFSDNNLISDTLDKIKIEEEKDNNLEKVIIDIKNKYGKNSIIKLMNLEEGATMIDRNKQIGGHSE